MNNARRLAEAVLMFYGTAGWAAVEREKWKALTGSDEATTKVLGNLARAVLEDVE